MQRQRVTLADGVEAAMRRAARAHVVFRVDLEEPKLRPGFENGLEMLRLESDADARRPEAVHKGPGKKPRRGPGKGPATTAIGDGHARLSRPRLSDGTA